MHPGLKELLSDAGISGNNSGANAANDGTIAASALTDLSGSLQNATQQIQALQQTTKQNADSIAANTQALSQNPESGGAGFSGQTARIAETALGGTSIGSLLTGGSGSSSGGLFGGLLGGLFGAVPLLSGIESLFGGGTSQPPPLTQYQAPLSQNFEEALSSGTVGDAVYGADGQPRSSSITELALSGIQSNPGNGVNAGTGSSSPGTASSPAQVTVNVQAMDSQSFMDRAADIANAVRNAMLNMHSINDVIGDL